MCPWSCGHLKEGIAAMATVTKKELVDRIAEQTGQKRTAVKDTIQAFLDSIIEELANDNRLEFRDFGVFEVKERAARTAQNPKTLERVHVPAKRTVRFKVGRLMKKSVEEVAAAETPRVVEPKPTNNGRSAEGPAVVPAEPTRVTETVVV